MKVLISAYACEPDKGSEPGAGWIWALAAAQNHDVWVVTRANNREAIESALSRDPPASLHFVYLDLPRWARFWKSGPRGTRLYYLLWQVLAGKVARELHDAHRFDVVHHLTFANVWLPALAWRARASFVLGPVGGGPRVPLRLYSTLGLAGAIHEVFRVAGQWVSKANPLTRAGWHRARVILVQNEETKAALPRSCRAKAQVRPNASVSADVPHHQPRSSPPRTVACAGRLLPWKGAALAIRALESLPRWQLVIIGDGPDRARLRRIAGRVGVAGRVEFVGWLRQSELWGRLAATDALILPSLREDASLIAAEATTCGVPVVAFDQGGPAVLARVPGARISLVPLGAPRQCVAGLAAAIRGLEEKAQHPPAADFSLEAVARDLDRVYRQATDMPVATSLEVAA